MSDRVFASIWLAVCALILVQMWQLDVPFAYEPVGPKAFPSLLAGLMAVCCVYMWVRPDGTIHWPQVPLLLKGTVLIAVLLAYANIFDLVGFPVATFFMVFALSRLFGAHWLAGSVSSVVISVAGFYLFDRILEVSLPLGRIWGA